MASGKGLWNEKDFTADQTVALKRRIYAGEIRFKNERYYFNE